MDDHSPNMPSERQRRLIPYMTFYVPSNDYHFPVNQAYNFMPSVSDFRFLLNLSNHALF